MARKAFRKISLWIPLEGNPEIRVNVTGGNKFLYSHPNRIPSPAAIDKPEIDLLKHGADTVIGVGRKFVKTADIVGRYDNGISYRHLQYRVR